MVDRLEWDETLSIRIAELDSQHRVLFKRVNAFLDSMEEHKEAEKVEDVLVFLEEYVQYHFDNEEKGMLEHGYPGYEEHLVQHERFISTVAYLKEK